MKILETERLYLRVFEESDVEAMSQIHRDEEAMKYIGRGGVLNIEQTKKSVMSYELQVTSYKLQVIVTFTRLILHV